MSKGTAPNNAPAVNMMPRTINSVNGVGAMPRMPLFWFVTCSIMIPHLRQFHSAFGEAIHDAVLLINPPRPPPGQRVTQRFGFADAGVRIAFDVLQQFVNPPDDLFVRLLPVLVIFPRLIREDQVHESRASLRRLPLPLTHEPDLLGSGVGRLPT